MCSHHPLRQTLLKVLGKGAAAGLLAGLLFLAGVEGVTGARLPESVSGLILFSFAGWSGVISYFVRLLRELFAD